VEKRHGREEEGQRRGTAEKRYDREEDREESVGAAAGTVAPTVTPGEKLSMASSNGKPTAHQARTVDVRPPSSKKGTTALKKRLTKPGRVGTRSRKKQTNGRVNDDFNVPLVLDREELVEKLQDCLTDFATEVGMRVACLLFDKQVDITCKRAMSGRSRPERRLSVPSNKGGRNLGDNHHEY
jgi:hypothetical protein